jgi:FkbM family methyltransferase
MWGNPRYREEMAKIMLDVGAHVGETLGVAMDPRWGFDHIYSFEPAPQCWPVLDEMADDRVDVLRFGLWNCDTTLVLHDPGMVGASLFESKRRSGTTAEVELKDAAVWFRDNIAESDEVVMKVNCEGAECDLLDHLLQSGEMRKVDALVVHFDVRKVPGQAHREVETRQRLEAASVPYQAAEDIFFGGNIPEKTANWLSWYHSSGAARLKYSHLRRAEYAVRVPLYNARKRVIGR